MSSRWTTVNPKAAYKLRGGACVYAIARNRVVLYVGKTHDLYMRLHKHVTTTGLDFRSEGVVVKYSRNRKYGEHAMREIRLIAKLNPMLNKDHRLSPAEMDSKPWLAGKAEPGLLSRAA